MKRGIHSDKKSKTPHYSGKNSSHPKKDLGPAGETGFHLKGKKTVKSSSEIPLRAGMSSLLENLISQYITEKIGKSNDDPILLDRLRQSIVTQKAMYWRDNPGKSVKYGRGYDILAYLAYHVPVYFTQFRSLIQGLENDGVLPKNLTLLDIGTGPGVVPLAFIDLWKAVEKDTLDIYALERSGEHREAYSYLVNAYSAKDPRIHVHDVVQEDLTKISSVTIPGLPEKAFIISFQNVLAELEHISIPARADLVLRYAEILDEKGFIIIVEPAELRHATSLRLLQRELVKSGFHVYAPCSYLWGSGCDPTSCWTFREEPSIKPTELMKLLAGEDEGYRFVNTDLKYAYVILTRQPLTRCTYRIPRRTRNVRLSHLERFSGRIVSVAGIRLSEDIGPTGMHIFKFCDGTCREPVYLVLSSRNRRPGHSPLFSVEYGDPVMISGAQVKRHPKHKAWNLIIGPDTRIERPSRSDSEKPDISAFVKHPHNNFDKQSSGKN